MIPSPKLIIIGILGAAFMGLAAYGLITYNQMRADRMAQQQALIDATQMAQRATSRADNAEVALAMQKEATARLEASLEAAQKATEEINQRFTEFRETAAKEEAVLDNVKFEKVFNGRPSLFVKKANEATKRQFDAMARALDGN